MYRTQLFVGKDVIDWYRGPIYQAIFLNKSISLILNQLTLNLRRLSRYLFFVEFFYYNELFGLQATLEFRCIEFEPTHPPIGMSLRKVLKSLRSSLYKRVSRSNPIVTTQVGYLGSEGFDLIPQNCELLLHVLSIFSDKFVFRPHVPQSLLMTMNIRTIHVD
jgi:hypothetical protein